MQIIQGFFENREAIIILQKIDLRVATKFL